MKWPHPWKLVKDLERKLQENQELAKRVARCRVADNELKPETREPARQFKTI